MKNEESLHSSCPVKLPLLPLAMAVLLAVPASGKGPISVILDTDMASHLDDVLALAVLHSLANREACQLRAVTISSKNEDNARFVDAVNTFYGRPDIPIGVAAKAPSRGSSYAELARATGPGDRLRYPCDLGTEEGPTTEEAVSLIRRSLAEAPDASVAIVMGGPAVNLAGLLDSEPDETSSLSGPELVVQKVRILVVTAGAFAPVRDNNHFVEGNVVSHIPAMQRLARSWPESIPTFWNGFEIGRTATIRNDTLLEDLDYLEHHIVGDAARLHGGPHRISPASDAASVLQAVFPRRGYFTCSNRGRVVVEDDGFTRFVPQADGRDCFLMIRIRQAKRVCESVTHLVVQPPGTYRTP